MKPDEKHIREVRVMFADMQTKEDLVRLLDHAKTLLYGEKRSPIYASAFTYYANPAWSKNRYKSFHIKKKNGGLRTINAPVRGLKIILRTLNYVLQCMYEPQEPAKGFVTGRSVADNARIHAGAHYVYNIDLKDFFHSFDRNRVKLGFMAPPFNLKGKREPLAFLLASLVTHPFEIDGKMKTVLPQGSPTSPTLTNILSVKLDRRLSGLANRFNLKYSRYADDITFSSDHNVFNKPEFLDELKRIIEEDQGLKINPEKTRLQKYGYRQEVTGLIVNEIVNVRRRYVKQIRQWIYYWETYGYDKAQYIFFRVYKEDKGHVKNANAKLINVLDGKLQYLKMIKGMDNPTYLKLKKRFDTLVSIQKNIKLEQVINTILSDGSVSLETLEKGLSLYIKYKKRQ